MSNSPRDSNYAPVIPHQSQAVSASSHGPGLPDPRPTVLVLDQLPEDCFLCQEDFDEIFSGTQSNVLYVAPHLDPLTGVPIDAINHISQNKIQESDRFCRVESESPPRDPQMIGPSGRSPSASPSPAVQPRPTLDSTDSRPLSPLPRSPASRLYSRLSPSSSALRSTQSTTLDRSPPRRFSPPPPSSSYLPTVALTRSPSPAANPASPELSRASKAPSKPTRSVSASQVPAVRAKRSASGTSAAPAQRPAAATTSAVPAKRPISATAPAPVKRAPQASAAPDAPRMTRSSSRQEPKPSGSRKRARAEEPLPPPPKRKRSKAEEPLPPPKRKAAKVQAEQTATTSGAKSKRSAKKQKADENQAVSQSSKAQSSKRTKPTPATQEPEKPVRRSLRIQTKRALSSSQK